MAENHNNSKNRILVLKRSCTSTFELDVWKSEVCERKKEEISRTDGGRGDVADCHENHQIS